jgi:N-glycosylase/DNA lyase
MAAIRPPKMEKGKTLQFEIPSFSLKETLESGQFFRFTKALDSYLVQCYDRMFVLRQEGDILFSDGVEESFIRKMFRLEDDFDSILREFDRDPIIHRAIQKYRGMRLIRQDPWECLFSFLCSSAKRVDHIRCMIESLCRCSGRKIQFGNNITYGFPEPLTLQTSHSLGGIGAGFRTSYLADANQCMDREKLLNLIGLPYHEAKQELMRLSGVGRKIADCILLYSLDFLEAFPIDTWMKKGLQKAYFHGKKATVREMEEFAANHFGPCAGYAQLYLYHYWRQNPRSIGESSKVTTHAL